MAIRAKHYEDTVNALKNDPIIQRMAAQLTEDGITADPENWGQVVGAINHYQSEGGEIISHYGGPIEAIAALQSE